VLASSLEVSADLLSVLGLTPALGRSFAAEEEHIGPHRVALLKYGLWQQRFGADPAIIGRDILLDDTPYTVVGVLPADIEFPTRSADLWVPLAFDPVRFPLDQQVAHNRGTADAGFNPDQLMYPVHIRIVTMGRPFDPKNKPIVWLGQTPTDTSLDFLIRKYDKWMGDSIQDHLIEAIGMHQAPVRVVPFLDNILQGNTSPDLRDKEAFWLAGQASDHLKISMPSVSDDLTDLRKEAVFALTQSDDDGVPLLIHIAQTHSNVQVRAQAIFWFGQHADHPEVIKVLKRLALE